MHFNIIAPDNKIKMIAMFNLSHFIFIRTIKVNHRKRKKSQLQEQYKQTDETTKKITTA